MSLLIPTATTISTMAHHPCPLGCHTKMHSDNHPTTAHGRLQRRSMDLQIPTAKTISTMAPHPCNLAVRKQSRHSPMYSNINPP